MRWIPPGDARRFLRLATKTRERCGLVFLAMLAAAGIAEACNVPVFRFALERWVSDNYALVVAHDKPLTSAQQRAADRLRALSWEHDGKANLSVLVLDVKAAPADPAVKHLPLDEVSLPAMFLFFPAGFGAPTLVWKAPLSGENVGRIARSPRRDAFVAEAVKGSTATWILVESGNAEEDDRAEQVLRGSLAAAQQELELPAGVILPSGGVTGAGTPAAEDNGYFDPVNQLDSGIPLKISFSVIRMSPDDPQEEVLRGILMKVGPGLAAKRGEPMAFPLFGRGRILAPLVGEEIRAETIDTISRYLCGPCSCQVKAQNPGVDLLLETDWEAELAGVSAIAERDLPPLMGIGALAGGMPADPSPAPGADESLAEASQAGARHLLHNAFVGGGAALALLLVLGTMVIMRKSR